MYRRDYLYAAGLVGLGGVVSLAGCSAAGSPSPGPAAEPTLPTEPDYGDWFGGVSNFHGTVDRRGEDAVAVDVGAPANMGAFGFGPAAVAVSPGTTVVWEWTGEGGGHNVVAEDGSFSSGALVDGAGHTFTYRFDEPGVHRYVCEPHRTMGMRGAIVVLAGERGR